MKSIDPYLNFEGNTEEAFEFYRSVFGGEFAAVLRFRDFGDGSMSIAEADMDKIAHIALPLGRGMLMGTDVVGGFPHKLEKGNNFFIAIEPESAAEADRLFERLSAGGEVLTALQQTEWAERHGSLVDRYGVQWMLDYTGSVQFAPPAVRGA